MSTSTDDTHTNAATEYTRPTIEQRLCNAAVKQAIDYAATLNDDDNQPLLFAVADSHLVAEHTDHAVDEDYPVSLVLQELPTDFSSYPGAFDGYIAALSWPDSVIGAVLVRHIQFQESASAARDIDSNYTTVEDADPTVPVRHARLVVGVLRGGTSTTVLVVDNDDKPSSLHGGDEIAPLVVEALLEGFKQ